MSKLTKSKMVLSHLKSGQTITSLDAINLYGATRLSAIIFNLRQRGLNIATLPTTIKDRFGNTTTYAKYKLLDLDLEPRELEEDLFSSSSIDIETRILTEPKPVESSTEDTEGKYSKNFLQRLWSKITSEE